MKANLALLIATSLLAAATTLQAATLYTATAQTVSRFNPTSSEANGRSFDDVFVTTPGGENSIHLDSVTFGIRRGPSGGFLVPVDVEFFAAVMTGVAGFELGPVFSLGTVSLDGRAAAGFVTETVTTTPNLDLNLNTAVTAGQGGLWVGMTFTGANAFNALNGWRIVTAPTVGNSTDVFGVESDVTPFTLFNFGGNPLADFYLTVEGSVSVVPEPATGALLGLGLLCGWARRRKRIA